MHRRGFSALAAGVVFTLMASPASAGGKKTFTALLNAGQEVPPTTSDAFGVAFLTFDGKTKTLCYAISFSRLTSTEVAAHVHGPAAPGVNANIVFPLTPVPGNPKNGCVGPFTGAVKKALKKGQLYLNIHTSENPNGEIRGQIIKTGG
jgi:hypothetical protein